MFFFSKQVSPDVPKSLDFALEKPSRMTSHLLGQWQIQPAIFLFASCHLASRLTCTDYTMLSEPSLYLIGLAELQRRICLKKDFPKKKRPKNNFKQALCDVFVLFFSRLSSFRGANKEKVKKWSCQLLLLLSSMWFTTCTGHIAFASGMLVSFRNAMIARHTRQHISLLVSEVALGNLLIQRCFYTDFKKKKVNYLDGLQLTCRSSFGEQRHWRRGTNTWQTMRDIYDLWHFEAFLNFHQGLR